MLKKNPFVSIIMPTYNGSKYIREAVNSVLIQTYENWELIIINDASTDSTDDIIVSFQKQDKRIKYIKNKRNVHVSQTRNNGLEYAEGDYIALLDDDDFWHSQKLEKQIAFLEKNDSFSAVGSCRYNINTDGIILSKYKQLISDYEIRNKALVQAPFTNSAMVIRRTCLKGLKYMIGYESAEDYYLSLELGLKGKLYNLQEYLVYYRIVEDGLSKQNPFKQRYLAFRIMLYFICKYPNPFRSLLERIYITFFPVFIKKMIFNMFFNLEQTKNR